MVRRFSRRSILRQGTLATSVGLVGCVGSFRGPSPEERLKEHEDSLERFTDVSTAIGEGYRTLGQYAQTDDGALGIPFVNFQTEALDPEKPQAVLYSLTEDGKYEPLGLKWFVTAEEYESSPSLFGKEFEGPLAGELDALPEQYTLHAWLFRDNPDGMFTLYNSALEPSQLVQRIDPVRRDLSEYLLGTKATDDGYRNSERCVATGDGGYGVPFIREQTEDSEGTEPEDPPVLLYRVTSNWSYQLMGAEWYVPVADTDSPPTLFGETFHDSLDGHSSKMNQPEHYGLHAWLFRANPSGIFAPFNPTVSC